MAAGAGALAGLGDFGFLGKLPSVSAAEATLEPKRVRLHAEIEPLVRLLENTPRERLLEEVASRIRRGATYREVVAALLLAGVRNIQPRPIGFKFHGVLVINSAHLASLSSAESDRWLPIFWALDQFKSSQAANKAQGDWSMGPVDESAIPPSHRARQALIDALENWDEAAADAAIVGLVRTAGGNEIFEILCKYGARDFREIGHKEIFVANSFRVLEVIGWHHAEPILRSVVYAMLDRNGEKQNPAKADLAPDRPFRRSLELVKNVKAGWLDGDVQAAGSMEMLRAIREGSPDDATAKVVELLNRGVSTGSIFDAYFNGAGELLMRAPGILSLHATTFTNAIHYGFRRCRDEETRKLMLLQNAAFLPLFRGNSKDKGLHVEAMEPARTQVSGIGALAEIFADMDTDRLLAARKILFWLKENTDPKPLADATRRMIFLKGRDAHDYKYSAAVLEDYRLMASPWRERYLAASAFYLKSAGAPENELVKRTRAALGA